MLRNSNIDNITESGVYNEKKKPQRHLRIAVGGSPVGKRRYRRCFQRCFTRSNASGNFCHNNFGFGGTLIRNVISLFRIAVQEKKNKVCIYRHIRRV
jgi:hypothetical protein